MGKQHVGQNLPVMIPFFSTGSSQLTRSDVSRISVKLRRPTGPGTEVRAQTHTHNGKNVSFVRVYLANAAF